MVSNPHTDASTWRCTGLYYYRARYYDPKVARFVSEDPVKWAISPNFYPYVANDPANQVDPAGLAPSTWCINCDPVRGTQASGAAGAFCRNAGGGKCKAAIASLGMAGCVNSWCNSNIPIVCQGECGGCGGPCLNTGSSPTRAIYLQMGAFNNPARCGEPPLATVAHEFAHLCGVGPDTIHPSNLRKAETIRWACGGGG